MTKIQNASPKPDMIYTPMFMPDTPVFLKQLKAAGVDIPVVTSDGNDTPDILTAGPEALDGMILTTFAYPEPGTALADFYASYKAKTGKEPETVIVANGYDLIQVLKAGAREERRRGRRGAARRDRQPQRRQAEHHRRLRHGSQTRQAKREVCLLKMDGDKFTFVKYLPYPSTCRRRSDRLILGHTRRRASRSAGDRRVPGRRAQGRLRGCSRDAETAS